MGVQLCHGCKKQFTPPLDADHDDYMPPSFWKEQGIELGMLLQCKRCKFVTYCSKDCQRQHWKQGHRLECIPVFQSTEEEDKMQMIEKEIESIPVQKAGRFECGRQGCHVLSTSYAKDEDTREFYAKSKKPLSEYFKKLKWCASCSQVCYCSKECQKMDWLVHRAECRRFQENKDGPKITNIMTKNEDEIVQSLVEISSSVFTVGEGRAAFLSARYKPAVFEMGQRLHLLGGIPLMQHVHAKVQRQLKDDRMRSGDSYELNFAWSGIGTWLP